MVKKAAPVFGVFLFFVPMVCLAAKTVLPDACGDPKVNFDVKTEKDQPAPAPPEPGKAQIVFIQTSKKMFNCGMGDAFSFGKLGCNAGARYGVDGAWAGATKGNSYFTLSVEPGVHHLCAVLGKEIDAESLTVEAGKVYYYQAKYDLEYKGKDNPTEKSVEYSILDEDAGKFRVKASELAVAKPKK